MRGAGVDDAGRRVFGLATFAFGAVTLAFPDYYDWLHLHWSAHDGRVFACAASAAQIVGGAAILFRRTAKAGAAILGTVYLVIALLSMPLIVAAPRAFSPYGDFFNQFAIVMGAAIAYTRLLKPSSRRAFERIGRMLFGVCAASFALYQACYLDVTAGLVPKYIPPSQMFWAVATTVLLALVPIALFTNRLSLLATRLLTLMLVLFGLMVWVPLVVSDPRNHFDWTEAAETFAIAGAAWILADRLRERIA